MWHLVQRSTVWNIACYHVYLQDSHVRCLVWQLVLNAGLYSLHGAFIHRCDRASLYLQFKGIATWRISYIIPERSLKQKTVSIQKVLWFWTPNPHSTHPLSYPFLLNGQLLQPRDKYFTGKQCKLVEGFWSPGQNRGVISKTHKWLSFILLFRKQQTYNE